MCDSVVNFKDMEERFGIDFPSFFSYELDKLQDPAAQRLAQVDMQAGTLSPTPIGFELIRNVCMIFDPNLRGKEPSGSTTI